MIKKLLQSVCLVLALSMLLAVCAFAAPSSMSPNQQGNSNSLIYIKKPASLSATTSEKTYTVSAAGRPGVHVAIYRRSNYDGQFYRVYQGGIGASGVYVVSIELIPGKNKIRVRAQNNDEIQIIDIDITRITQSQLDRINGLSIGDLFDAY